MIMEYMESGNLTQVLDAAKKSKKYMSEGAIAYVCLEVQTSNHLLFFF